MTDILILFFSLFSGIFKTLVMKSDYFYNWKNYSTEINNKRAQYVTLYNHCICIVTWICWKERHTVLRNSDLKDRSLFPELLTCTSPLSAGSSWCW